jgi:hypothetical protein
MKKVALALLLSVGLAPLTNAETRWVWGVYVWEVAIDTDRFGQCLVRLNRTTDIQAILPLCKAEYLTLDCGAELPGSTKSNSRAKLDLALAAQLTNQKASFLVTDEQTINGYCVAKQVRLLGH